MGPQRVHGHDRRESEQGCPASGGQGEGGHDRDVRVGTTSAPRPPSQSEAERIRRTPTGSASSPGGVRVATVTAALADLRGGEVPQSMRAPPPAREAGTVGDVHDPHAPPAGARSTRPGAGPRRGPRGEREGAETYPGGHPCGRCVRSQDPRAASPTSTTHPARGESGTECRQVLHENATRTTCHGMLVTRRDPEEQDEKHVQEPTSRRSAAPSPRPRAAPFDRNAPARAPRRARAPGHQQAPVPATAGRVIAAVVIAPSHPAPTGIPTMTSGSTPTSTCQLGQHVPRVWPRCRQLNPDGVISPPRHPVVEATRPHPRPAARWPPRFQVRHDGGSTPGRAAVRGLACARATRPARTTRTGSARRAPRPPPRRCAEGAPETVAWSRASGTSPRPAA